MQSTPPYPVFPRLVLILSTHLLLCLPSDLFPSDFRTNNLYAFLFSPIRATCAAHLIFLYLIILIILGEEYRSGNSSLCSFFHPLVNVSLFGPNILLSIFSQTPSVYVSQPYGTKGKIIVLYILIFYVF
jgi:hypothetical protein